MAPSRATSASLGSSRGGTAASTMPAAGPVGRSFSECTARSTSPPSSASRSALTKTPVPPIWVSCARLTSPSVVTPTISTGRPVRSVIMPATWRDCAMAIGLLRLPSLRVTEPPGGCPGLQAGEEFGAPRSGAGKYSRPYGAAPAVFRSHVRSCNGEDGLQVQGLPRPGAAAGAEPHVRLRPGRVEPHPGRPPGPLAPGRARATSYAESGRALTAMKKDPDLAFLNEVSSRAVAAGAAAPAQGVRRVLRQACPVPAVQVPPVPAVRALHPQRVHHARRPAAAGQDGCSCPVRVVLAGCGREHAGPGDGDRLAGARRTLVRDLHRRHGRPAAPGGDWARRRHRSRRDGLRRHQ